MTRHKTDRIAARALALTRLEPDGASNHARVAAQLAAEFGLSASAARQHAAKAARRVRYGLIAAGRPPAAGTRRQVRVTITMPPEYRDWLRQQGDVSATLRRLIGQAMQGG